MVQKFPRVFLGGLRNFPRAEFSPVKKSPYNFPPPRYVHSRAPGRILSKRWGPLGLLKVAFQGVSLATFQPCDLCRVARHAGVGWPPCLV